MDALTHEQHLQSERWKLQVQSGSNSPIRTPLKLHGGAATFKTLPVMSPILASAHLARGPKLLLQQFKDYTQTGGLTLGKHSLSYTHSEMDKPPGGGFRQPLFVGDQTMTKHNGNTISILHPEDSVDVFEGLKSSEQAGAYGGYALDKQTGAYSSKFLTSKNALSFQNIKTKPAAHVGSQTEHNIGADSELCNIPSNIVNESNGGLFSAISGENRQNSPFTISKKRCQSGNFLVLPLKASPAPRTMSFHKNRETSTMADGQTNSDLNQANETVEMASPIPLAQNYKFIPSPGLHNRFKHSKPQLKMGSGRGQSSQIMKTQYDGGLLGGRNSSSVNRGGEIIVEQEDQGNHSGNRKAFKSKSSAVSQSEPPDSHYFHDEDECSQSHGGTNRDVKYPPEIEVNRQPSVASRCLVKQASPVPVGNITSLVFAGTPFDKNARPKETSKHQVSYYGRNGNSHLGLLEPNGGGRSVISSQQKRLDHSSQTSSSLMELGAEDPGISGIGSSRVKVQGHEPTELPGLPEFTQKARKQSRDS